ncbi:MAG: esterase [Deltaproteobacteria bacterium]|nr:esterase [Deltaproteobacteria bacterium]
MKRKNSLMKIIITLIVAMVILSLSANIYAQAKKPAFPQAPVINSPEVLSDKSITFRILAPEATKVGLQSSDIFGMTTGNIKFTKNSEGVWEGKTGPLVPGAYRYTFTVDGASVVDPNNTSISESNNNVWSLAYVPGADFMEMKQVPHGAVAEVYYYSKTLGIHRRMHIYTPPGYESGSKKYPVFYLLHGAMDCDDSWSTVGRAGFIIDNLINDIKAKPMVVVMPAGHTTGDFSMGGSVSAMVDDFSKDFINEIMPYVENNYRVLTDRENRAIAGLSMGGMQTLDITMKDLGKFAYIGVFSSGIFGPGSATPGQGQSPNWEDEHRAMLDNSDMKKGLKLIWFATGKEDFLIETTRASVEMLNKHGFSPVYNETDGGHTWAKWRDYLVEFTPELFK